MIGKTAEDRLDKNNAESFILGDIVPQIWKGICPSVVWAQLYF